MMQKQYIKDLLKMYSVFVVTFTKKDMSIRNMICTQDFDYIPSEFQPKPKSEGEPTRVLSDDVARVYDFEAKGWRSFPYDQVIEINFYMERND